MTISAAERFISSSSLMPVGMPRPLSRTEMELSVWIVTTISSQKPARASSTELSTTSNTMWCRPVPSDVSPMYMPGRLRTASRPFRILMASEPYSLGFAAKSDPHRHDDVLEALLARVADQRARRGVAKCALELITRDVVQDVEQIVHVEADIERVAGILHLDLLLRLLLVGVRGDDLQAAVGQHPAHAAELLVGKDRRTLQRLTQRLALGLELVLMRGGNDSRVVGKLAIDQLGDDLDRAEAEAGLRRREFDLHFLVAVGEELREFHHGLPRNNRFLARGNGMDGDESEGGAVSVGRNQVQFGSVYYPARAM